MRVVDITTAKQGIISIMDTPSLLSLLCLVSFTLIQSLLLPHLKKWLSLHLTGEKSRSSNATHLNYMVPIPGDPVLGRLRHMGNNHVRNLQDWAKQYGPVFLVRLGKRVSYFLSPLVLIGDS